MKNIMCILGVVGVIAVAAIAGIGYVDYTIKAMDAEIETSINEVHDEIIDVRTDMVIDHLMRD